MRDAEALLEFGPDIAAQAIAAGEPQLMLVFLRGGRRIDEIAAELADILKERALPCDDVRPKAACREFVCNHHRSAGDEDGADRNHPANAVVERQAIVYAVARLEIAEAVKPERQ